MAHYAKIENNIVVDVKVANIEDEATAQNFLRDLLDEPSSVWKKTSYNTKFGKHYTNGVESTDQSKAFRGNYAFIGGTYDSVNDIFLDPKPFDSWTLNVSKAEWEPPVARPEKDGNNYRWSEVDQIWILV